LRWPSCLVMERRSSPIWLPPFDALENAVSDSFAQEIGTGSLLPQGSAVDWMNFSPCTDHQSPDMSTPWLVQAWDPLSARRFVTYRSGLSCFGPCFDFFGKCSSD
jgi:hypothetical protein